jgi:hypothetical protein
VPAMTQGALFHSGRVGRRPVVNSQ